jgi:signal transduction histidine kinase
VDTPSDDLRRERLARAPLVDLSLMTLLGLVIARLRPGLEPWFGPPRGVILWCAVAGVLLSLSVFFQRRRDLETPWLIEIAWAVQLLSVSLLSGASTAPLGMASALHAAAIVIVAAKDPSDVLMVIVGASAALAPLVRAAVGNGAPVTPVALVMLVAMFAFVIVVSLGRRASRAVAERDMLLAEISRVARAHTSAQVSSVSKRERKASAPPVVGATQTRTVLRKSGPDDDEEVYHSWEVLLERLKHSLSALAESAGIEATVHIDIAGLAPPSAKIRSHLIKIVQEAAQQTIRFAEPRSIEVVVRRARGGVEIELMDDAPSDDGSRHRRAVGMVKGRVAPLGGTAEVERGAKGWTMRVQLPAEQLN